MTTPRFDFIGSLGYKYEAEKEQEKWLEKYRKKEETDCFEIMHQKVYGIKNQSN